MPLRSNRNRMAQIRAIGFKSRNKSTKVQSLLFKKDKFHSKDQVRRKLREMEKSARKVETKRTWNYYRSRQVPPSKFDESSFRVIKLGDGIKAVIGKPK